MKSITAKIIGKVLKGCDNLGIFISSFRLLHEHRFRQGDFPNERPLEYSFALSCLNKFKMKKILDVGTGANAFSATLKHCGFDMTASDLMGNYWKSYQNRHIYVVKDDITKSQFQAKSFDAVICISVLEHIPDFKSAVANMAKIIRQEGILILTFPYSHDTFCDNVYKLDTADPVSKKFKFIARSYSESQIEEWCKEFNLVEIERKLIKGWDGKFWRNGNRLDFPVEVFTKEDANCICLAFKKMN